MYKLEFIEDADRKVGLRLCLEDNGKILQEISMKNPVGILWYATLPKHTMKSLWLRCAPYKHTKEIRLVMDLARGMQAKMPDPNTAAAIHMSYANASAKFNTMYRQVLDDIDPEVLKVLRRYQMGDRANIHRYIIEDGKYAMQLAQVFPVMALYIARNISVVDCRMENIRRAVREGRPMKEILPVADLPKDTMQLRPWAASVVMDHALWTGPDAWKRIDYKLLPLTAMEQYRWAKLLMRSDLLPHMKWLSKNFSALGKTISVKQVNIGMIVDFLKAVKGCGRCAPGEVCRNGCHLAPRIFNEKTGVKRTLELAHLWHIDYNRYQEENRRRGRVKNIFPQPWTPDGEYIKYIRDSYALDKEGLEMHHCVASYGSRVMRDECQIYSYCRGKNRATIEVRKMGGLIHINQIQGPYNSSIDDNALNEIRRFFRDANAELQLTIDTETEALFG